MTASIWEPGSVLVANPTSTIVPQAFTATAGQTLFTLTQFTYALNASALMVFLNGVYQKSGTDYQETSTSSITFNTGLQAGDIVVVVGLVSITGTGTPVISSAMIPVFTAASIAAARSALNVPAVGDDVADGSIVTDGQLIMATGALLGRTTGGDGEIQAITAGNGISLASQILSLSTPSQFQDFRLSLVSGTPVTITDQTAKTIVYMVPYMGNRISLYSGGIWTVNSSAGLSIAVPNAANTNYDVFCRLNGSPELVLEAWATQTARVAPLAYQNGILCSGTLGVAYHYIGTFCTTAVAGQTEDSYLNRLVWNYKHRVDRPMKVTDTTNSWTYNTAAWRQANAAAANAFSYIQGVSEEPVEASVRAVVSNTNPGVYPMMVGVGVDSTTVNSTSLIIPGASPAANARIWTAADYRGYPGIGKHTLNWLEYSDATITTTFYGDDGGTLLQSGMTGVIRG